MTKKNNSKNKDKEFFWATAGRFLNYELPEIRKNSLNTVSAYRNALNIYIDYLELVKGKDRSKICFDDFNKDNLKDYLVWSKAKWTPKTCNLRMTAIRSMLSFASEESVDVMPIYMACKNIRGLKAPNAEIEYFEDYQLSAILDAPKIDKRTEWRNKIILILGYDAALRVGELIILKVADLHLEAEIPYISIMGKGLKYRNVPLTPKTIRHIESYLEEFHADMDPKKPLFFTTTHGNVHGLSDDTAQKILKKYADECREKIHMPKDIYFHMLRKTRAMNLYQAGCPLSYIQQMLGHENISTTSGFYAFVTLNTLAKALEKANPSSSDEKTWKNTTVMKKLFCL